MKILKVDTITADVNDQYTIDSSHIPTDIGCLTLLKDGGSQICSIQNSGHHLEIILITDKPCNIWIDVEVDRVSIDAQGDISVDSPMKVKSLRIKGKEVVLFGNLELNELICTADDALIFQDGVITTHQLLKIKSPRVAQHTEVNSLGKSEFEIGGFYADKASQTNLQLTDTRQATNSFGDIIIDAGSVLKLARGKLQFNSIINQGTLELTAVHSSLPSTQKSKTFRMMGSGANLTARQSDLSYTHFNVLEGKIDATDSKFSSQLMDFQPSGAECIRQELSAETLNLGGQCQFKTASSINVGAHLNVIGTVTLSDSKCQASNNNKNELVVINGNLNCQNSVISFETMMMKENGKMKVNGSLSDVSIGTLQLSDKSEFTLDSCKGNVKDIVHGGTEIIVKNRANLIISNDFHAENNSNSLIIRSAELTIKNDFSVINVDADYATLNLKKLSVRKGSGMCIVSSVLTVTEKAELYGGFEAHDSTVEFNNGVSVHSAFSLLGGQSKLTVAKEFVAQNTANLKLSSTAVKLESFILHGKLTLTALDELKVSQEFTIAPFSNLTMEGGRISAGKINHEGVIVIPLTKIKSPSNKAKNKRSKLLAEKEFTATRGSMICSGQTDPNDKTCPQLVIESPQITTMGQITLPYLKCKGDDYVNDRDICVSHFILKMNSSGTTAARIDSDTMEIYMPLWQNNATVHVRSQLFSRTLIEQPGILRAVWRDSKTLLTLGLDISVFIPPSLSDLFNQEHIKNFLFQLFAPQQIVAARTSYQLAKLLVSGGLDIKRKLSKRFAKEYCDEPAIFKSLARSLSQTQNHELLRVLWAGPSAIRNAITIGENLQSIPTQLAPVITQLGPTVQKIVNDIDDAHSKNKLKNDDNPAAFTMQDRCSREYLNTACAYVKETLTQSAPSIKLPTVPALVAAVINNIPGYFQLALPAQLTTSLISLNLFNVSLNQDSWNFVRINCGIDLSLFRTLNSVVLSNCGFSGAVQSTLMSTYFVNEGLVASYKLHLAGEKLQQNGTVVAGTDVTVLYAEWLNTPGSHFMTPGMLIAEGKIFKAAGANISATSADLNYTQNIDINAVNWIPATENKPVDVELAAPKVNFDNTNSGNRPNLGVKSGDYSIANANVGALNLEGKGKISGEVSADAGTIEGESVDLSNLKMTNKNALVMDVKKVTTENTEINASVIAGKGQVFDSKGNTTVRTTAPVTSTHKEPTSDSHSTENKNDHIEIGTTQNADMNNTLKQGDVFLEFETISLKKDGHNKVEVAQDGRIILKGQTIKDFADKTNFSKYIVAGNSNPNDPNKATSCENYSGGGIAVGGDFSVNAQTAQHTNELHIQSVQLSGGKHTLTGVTGDVTDALALKADGIVAKNNNLQAGQIIGVGKEFLSEGNNTFTTTGKADGTDKPIQNGDCVFQYNTISFKKGNKDNFILREGANHILQGQVIEDYSNKSGFGHYRVSGMYNPENPDQATPCDSYTGGGKTNGAHYSVNATKATHSHQFDVNKMTLTGGQHRFEGATGSVENQIQGQVKTEFHDTSIEYGTMQLTGSHNRTGNTTLTATGHGLEELVRASKQANPAATEQTWIPVTQVISDNKIEFGKGTSGNTGDTYYKCKEFVDHSKQKFDHATQFVDANKITHDGNASGERYILKSQEKPVLQGETKVQDLQLDCPALESQDAQDFIQGNGPYQNYQAAQSLSITADCPIPLTQETLKRNINLTIYGSSVTPQEGLQNNDGKLLHLHSKEDTTIQHPVTGGNIVLQSDRRLKLQTGANAIGQQVTVQSGNGDLEINAKCRGSDFTNFFMKNYDYKLILRNHQTFEIHLTNEKPSQNKISPGHLYLYYGKHGMKYYACDAEGNFHKGHVEDLPISKSSKHRIKSYLNHNREITPKLHELLKEAFKEISDEVIVRHDLGQAELKPGDGASQEDYGMLMDVGHVEVHGPVRAIGDGHIGGVIETYTETPNVTTRKHKEYKEGHSLLQRLTKMERKKVSEKQIVFHSNWKSNKGLMGLEVRKDMATQAGHFYAKQGISLTVGGQETLQEVKTTDKATSNMKTPLMGGRAWKKSKDSNQNAHLTQFKSDGPIYNKSEGEMHITGARFECAGGKFISPNKIILSAPILEKKSVKIDHNIKVLVNGVDAFQLLETVTSTATSLFSDKNLPKQKWLSLFKEICVKEPMIGVIGDCIDADSLYDKIARGWNAGLTGVELIHDLAQGINQDNLKQAIAKRYKLAESDVKVEFSRSKRKLRVNIVDGNAGIHSSGPVEFQTEKLQLMNGVIVKAQGLFFKVRIIEASPAELDYSIDVETTHANLGFNGNLNVGGGRSRHTESGTCRQAPSLISVEIHFGNVEQVTGTMNVYADKLTGHIKKIELISIPDNHYQKDNRFSASTSGSASAFRGSGKKTTKGAGFSIWKANDAKEFSCGELNSTGGIFDLPGAQLGTVKATEVPLEDNYNGLGLGGNLKEINQFMNGTQNSEPSVFVPIQVEADLRQQKGMQQAVLNHAKTDKLEGQLCTDGTDGYQAPSGPSLKSTIIVPLTNDDRLKHFSDEVSSAIKKLQPSVKHQPHAQVAGIQIQVQLKPVEDNIPETDAVLTQVQNLSDKISNAVHDDSDEIEPTPNPKVDIDPDDDLIFSPSFTDLDIEFGELPFKPIKTSNNDDDDVIVTTTTPTASDLFNLGFRHGAAGMFLPEYTGNHPQPDQLDIWDRLCIGLGALASDMPVITTAAETVSTVALLVKASPQGAVVSALAGAAAFSAPTLIREIRNHYHQYQQEHPESDFSFVQFIEKHGVDILVETATAAVSGAAVGVTGSAINANLLKLKPAIKLPAKADQIPELNTLGKTVSHAGNATALGTIPDLVHGELPSQQSFTDNLILYAFAQPCLIGMEYGANKLNFHLNQRRYYPLPKTLPDHIPPFIYPNVDQPYKLDFYQDIPFYANSKNARKSGSDSLAFLMEPDPKLDLGRPAALNIMEHAKNGDAILIFKDAEYVDLSQSNQGLQFSDNKKVYCVTGVKQSGEVEVRAITMHEMQHGAMEFTFKNDAFPYSKNATSDKVALATARRFDQQKLSDTAARLNLDPNENMTIRLIYDLRRYPSYAHLQEIPAFVPEAYYYNPGLTEQIAPAQIQFLKSVHEKVNRNTERAPVDHMLEKLDIKMPEVQQQAFTEQLMQELKERGLADKLFDHTQSHSESFQYRHQLIDAIQSQKWSLKDGKVDPAQVAKTVADRFQKSQGKTPPSWLKFNPPDSEKIAEQGTSNTAPLPSVKINR